MRPDDMREVEIVDDDLAARRPAADSPDGQLPDETTAGADTAQSSGSPGRRRLRGGLVVGAVAVTLLVAQTVLDARERSELARLSTVPGVLAPMAPLDGEPLRVQLTLDLSVSRGAYLVGDLIVVQEQEPTEPATVLRAYRSGTAGPVWSTALPPVGPDVDYRNGPVSAAGVPRCTPTGSTDEPGPLACLVPAAADTGAAAPDPGGTALLVLLDPRTGVVRAERGVDAEGLTTVGGHLVLVGSAGDTVLLTAMDPVSGESRWEFSVPGTLDEVAAWPLGDDLVEVTAIGQGSWVLAADGEVVARTPGADLQESQESEAMPGVQEMWEMVEQARPGIFTVVGTQGQAPTPTTMILDPAGWSGVQIPHQLAAFTVDDGSVPDVLFSLGGPFEFDWTAASENIRAWDVRTGALLWENTSQLAAGVILLDGVLYGATTTSSLVAIDARTGATLWETELDPGPQQAVHTDGRALLVTPADGTDPVLLAFDLHDGHPLWSRPIPGSYDLLTSSQVPGYLVGYGDQFATLAVLG